MNLVNFMSNRTLFRQYLIRYLAYFRIYHVPYYEFITYYIVIILVVTIIVSKIKNSMGG